MSDSKEIVDIISTYTLTHNPDLPLWKWYLYDFISFRGVRVEHAIIWWQLPVPHKVKESCYFKIRFLKRHCCIKKVSKQLFLKCPYLSQIWFWMQLITGLGMPYSENSKLIYTNWILNLCSTLKNDIALRWICDVNQTIQYILHNPTN